MKLIWFILFYFLLLLLVYLRLHSWNGLNVLIGWLDLPTLQIISKSVPHLSPSTYTKINDTLQKILSSMMLVFLNCNSVFCKSLKNKENINLLGIKQNLEVRQWGKITAHTHKDFIYSYYFCTLRSCINIFSYFREKEVSNSDFMN